MLRFFRKIRKDSFLKKKVGNYILYALGEVLLIVIGVLFALYLQNKNESKKTTQKVKTTLSMIKKEVKTNEESIKKIVTYRTFLQDTLSVLIKTELPKTDKEINDSFNFWKGVGSSRLLNSAFQTGIQTGINTELNPELLELLNQLYTQQDVYNNLLENIPDIFINTDFTNRKQIPRLYAILLAIINDLKNQETQLLKLYKKTSTKINEL